MKKSFHIPFLTVLLFIIACDSKKQDLHETNQEPVFVLPDNFPQIQYPSDNAYSYSRWLLGKKLFYDNALSSTNTINCGSCHQSAHAMADNVAFSLGVKNRVGVRNAPTLTNVAYNPYYNYDGGNKTLEMQVLVPIQEHVEFDFNIIEIAKRLSTNTDYQNMSNKAYGRGLDYYVITRALANFERTLISGNSKYDKYLKKEVALTEAEQNGHDLFMSNTTNCNQCHSGFNFTNYTFENNGLSDVYDDIGRERVTKNTLDNAKFKVPTLRNIAYTAPYMHNGSITNLLDVVKHYNSGGKNHANKSNLIKPLNLTSKQMDDLVAFLQTLTDDGFINNPLFKNN